MGILHLERLGGIAGLGTGRARIRSQGNCDTASLDAAELQVLEDLFQQSEPPSARSMDEYRLRLTQQDAGGSRSVVVPESSVPAALLKHLRDELL